jgi:hypothetical protein
MRRALRCVERDRPGCRAWSSVDGRRLVAGERFDHVLLRRFRHAEYEEFRVPVGAALIGGNCGVFQKMIEILDRFGSLSAEAVYWLK